VYASSFHWRLLIGTILALMAAAWLAPRWVRAPGIQENRPLAARPAWPRRLGDIPAFRKSADAYVADHFPVRRHLIGVLNRARMLAGVSGSPRVIVGRRGWLFYDNDTHLGAARDDPPMSGSDVRGWLSTLAGRTEFLRARGIGYLVVAPPAKETIYPQFGPAWYHGPNPHRPTITLPQLARTTGAGEALYLYEPIAQATRRARKTFSRHDTHWTAYGAYAGYAGLMGKLHGMGLAEGPLPLSAFAVVTRGPAHSPRDLALMLGVASFVDVVFPRIDNPRDEARMRVTYLSGKRNWTGPQVIDTGQTGKPVLLMTRDSFSNELLPMLLPHFSRIVLAHNQDGFWRPDLIARFKPNVVILEVVESGLRVSMGEGPPPSDEARARIDQVLGPRVAPAASGASAAPALTPGTPAVLAALDAARLSGACNVEVATLSLGGHGGDMLKVSGWLSELAPSATSPEGFVRLRGPGLDALAALRVDKSRPDVAAHFANPAAQSSGFAGAYAVARLRPGAYRASVYRRAGQGWMGCSARQPLVAP
jgi:hypothetical protein